MPSEPTAQAAVARAICARHDDDPAALIEIFHDLQEELGCVPQETLPEIADALNIGKAEAHGALSFYPDFHGSPAGRVVVKLCRAEACQSMGVTRLIEAIRARHAAGPGETSAAGVTFEAVYCLGNCALAPAALVNGRPVGRLDADRLDAAIKAAWT